MDIMKNPDEIFAKVKQECSRVDNMDLIIKAYNYAREKHASNKPRMTGEPYICHPARVALILAGEGMESEIIAAAFLHDVIEDCEVTKDTLAALFGGSVAKIVDSVSALSKRTTAHLTKEERDNQSYHKFLNGLSMANQAIYIKLADRLDNLRTMGNMPDERMLNKLQETEDFYLPLAEFLNIHLFIPEIKDWIYKLRNLQRYLTIRERYEELMDVNALSVKCTRELMEHALHHLDVDTGELVDLQKRVQTFYFQERTVASLARALQAREIDINTPAGLKAFNKYNIPLFDIYLIMSNEDITPVDSFYFFYEKYLVNYGLLINGFGCTTDGTQPFLLLTDRMEITYRLFLHSTESYNYYLYGMDTRHNGECATKLHDILVNFNEIDPRKTYSPKITVLTKDGDEKQIDSGSTVLDLAFYIHKDLGLNMSYAVINGLKTTNLATRLHHGDQVIIVPVQKTEPVPAKLEWFRWVNTSRARHELYKWLNSGTIQINVLDMNRNQYFHLPKNASVLDHLLLLDESPERTMDTIQHVAKVFINEVPYLLPEALEKPLHHKDKIRLEYDEEVTYVPNVNSFAYLNCKQAREKMIEILQALQ